MKNLNKIDKGFLLFFISLYIVINLFYPYTSRIIKYNVGDTAKGDIIASFDFPVLKNEEELRREMNITSLSVPPVLKAIEYNVEFSKLKKNVPQQVIKLIIDARNTGIVFDKKTLPQSFGDFYEITKSKETKVVTKNDFYSYNEIKELILKDLLKKFDTTNAYEILKEIEPFIQPNLLLDISETEKRRENARKTVSKEKSFIKKGETIVRRNDIITQEILDIINSLKLAEKNVNKTSIARRFAKTQPIILILIFIFSFIIKEYWKEIFSENKHIMIISTITFFILLFFRIFQELGFVILVPLSLGAMFLALEGGTLAGFIYTLFISSLFLIFNPYEVLNVLPLIFSGIIGSVYIRKVGVRKEIVKLVIYLSLATFFTSFGVDIIQNKNLTKVTLDIIFSLLNCGMSCSILFGLLFIFERLLGISTNFSYLEFANLNQPLLTRLILYAPGTYHHSVMVGNLSEAAAEAIGANPSIAKVGGYYHDIGKLERPEYFIENINPQINPHNELPPKLSVSILRSHITDGVIIGKEYHLPEEIIKIIWEHHGNTLIRPFFEKAKDIYDNIDEKEYSYDCPTPSSKESSIVMLADSVEAASKSAEFENEEDIKTLVDKIIEMKLQEEQLDNGNISLKDLKIIKEVFTKRLIAAYHTRIKYPKVVLK